MVSLHHVEVEGGSILKGRQTPLKLESSSSLKGSLDSSRTVRVTKESYLAKHVGSLQKREDSDLAEIHALVQKKIEPSPESMTMGTEEYRRLAVMIPQMIY